MSTCHQAHNIPWSSFLEILHKIPSTHFEHFAEQGIFDAYDFVFTPDENGRVYNKVRFFARKVEAAIREFSQTERKKYQNDDIDKISKLYDVDGENSNKWLGEDFQEIAKWEYTGNSWCRQQYLEPVKELFIQEKVESLLAIARRGIPIESLQFVTYSNFFHYGIGRIKEDCLTLYIHLNLLLATGTLQEPKHWYSQWRRFLDGEILTRYDGNSNARMYKEYFVNNPTFQDLNGLQELLKKLFRMLYLYDMIMNERGVVISWEREVLDCVGSYFMDRSKRASFTIWGKQEEEKRNE